MARVRGEGTTVWSGRNNCKAPRAVDAGVVHGVDEPSMQDDRLVDYRSKTRQHWYLRQSTYRAARVRLNEEQELPSRNMAVQIAGEGPCQAGASGPRWSDEYDAGYSKNQQ